MSQPEPKTLAPRKLRAFYDPAFEAPIGNHIMPIQKFRKVADQVAGLEGVRLVSPNPAGRADLERVHSHDYVEAIRTGRGPGRHDLDAAGDEWRAYAAPDLVRWRELVPETRAGLRDRGVVLEPGGHVVDVACGSGLLAYSLIEECSDGRATVIDRPEVLEIARRLAEAMGIADRVTFVAGDLSEVDLGVGAFDLALCVNVAQYLDDDRLAGLLGRLHAALRPGGALYLSSVIADDGTQGESGLWASSVEMFLASGIDQRSVDGVGSMIGAAGFDDLRHIPPTRFTARRRA